jgi:RNA-binding protein
MTDLTKAQREHLRRLGHDLKPVVLMGAAGLTDPVLAEIRGALDHHELVKVRVRGTDRDGRDATIGRICAETGAELVQRIGHVALLWRPNPERRRVSLPAG